MELYAISQLARLGRCWKMLEMLILAVPEGDPISLEGAHLDRLAGH